MVLDFAKEAIDNLDTHSINFDDLKAGKANIKVFGVGGCGGNATTWLFNKGISMIQSLSSHKESIRSMLFLIVGVPIFLLLDSEHGDALVGNGQWVANILVFLAFIRAYRNGTQRVRNVLLIGVIVGLLGEFLFSRVLGMYHYRLDNIPLWLAFAHGLIFAWTLKMAKKPFLQAGVGGD